MTIKSCDFKCRHLEIIGQELQFNLFFLIIIPYQYQCSGIQFFGPVPVQYDGLVSQQPGSGIEVEIALDNGEIHHGFGPGDKVRPAIIDISQSSKVDMGLVHHIDRFGCGDQAIQHVAVVVFSVGDQDKSRDTAPEIQ